MNTNEIDAAKKVGFRRAQLDEIKTEFRVKVIGTLRAHRAKCI